MRRTEASLLRIPGIFPVATFEHASRQGVDVDALLRAQGIYISLDQWREAGMDFGSMAKALTALSEAYADPALGFRVGREVPVTALGPVGFGMMSSATLRDAIAFLRRYWDLVGRTLQVEDAVADGFYEAQLVPEVPVEGTWRRWILESGLTCMRQAFTLLLPVQAETCELMFDLPEPAHAAEMRRALGKVTFDAPVTAVRFPAAWLELALPTASRAGLRQAEQLCEAQLAFWGQPEPLLNRVRRQLGLGAGGYPSLASLASQLHMSTRTLRRRLSDEGQSYGRLLLEARRRDAMRLLGDERLSLAAIAERLGYVEPANFTRAFRQWTGMTPSEWRQRQRAPGTGSLM